MDKHINNIKERLLRYSFPEPNTGCWLWGHATNKNGYGSFSKSKGNIVRAHRASYEAFIGPIPKDLCVLHHCDVRPCINPDHLFIGSKSDNSIDMIKKGRGNDCRGEKSSNAKLTSSLVLEIRHKYNFDRIPAKRLARDYGLNISTVRAFLKRRSWKHIGDSYNEHGAKR